MKVQSSILKPVKQKDGSWKVVVEHFEEEVPFPERKYRICQFCRYIGENYPDCLNDCYGLKGWIASAEKLHGDISGF